MFYSDYCIIYFPRYQFLCIKGDNIIEFYTSSEKMEFGLFWVTRMEILAQLNQDIGMCWQDQDSCCKVTPLIVHVITVSNV